MSCARQHARTRIRSIDTAACEMPGVLAVLTGADVKADGLKDIPHTPIPMKPPADILLINRDGTPHGYAPQALLPADRVRYVGQQVVIVVAETVAAAKDAAERVTVDYDVRNLSPPPPARSLTRKPTTTPPIRTTPMSACGVTAAFARAAHVAKTKPGRSASPACCSTSRATGV
jgi:carbon-monoxide dehydrogenase large subunit